MNRLLSKGILLVIMLCMTSIHYLMAQTTHISGLVVDADSKVELIGVNIIVKGKVLGTTTGLDGTFELNVDVPTPLTLEFSMVGYKTQEITIDKPETTGLKVEMSEEVLMGQEVVVSASRVQESILKSPVSIEKMDVLGVQQTPADNYYKGIGYMQGVDVTQSSINFQIVNARGFNSTGNTRFVQLTDGMDTQAPALNFPIGNLNGPSELDVESVEFLPGAASALYGPNAFNGVLLVTSKSPFEYQGFSAFAKFGMNHFGDDTNAGAPSSPQPMYEASVRYAKSLLNDRLAFKLNASYMEAKDWYATDYSSDRNAGLKPAGISFNPGSDFPNMMGDEASVNLAILRLSSDWVSLTNILNNYYAINGGKNPIDANGYAQNGFLPNQVASVTPYPEYQLIDYGAKNAKFNAGLYYRLTDKIELSYLVNYGFGTSIYTGAQRYSLKNFSIGQHRIQLKSPNWYLRAYATLENSGDSYITEFYAKRINDLSVKQAIPIEGVSAWLGTYAYNYLRYINDDLGLTPSDNPNLTDTQKAAAFQYARSATNSMYHLDPNSEAFKKIEKNAMEGTVPQGPRFNDHTKLYHVEGQYDFSDKIDFMDLQVGASLRIYDLQSNGTIFPDTAGNPITIKEYGAFAQASKKLFNDNFKLTASARLDKNQNFKAVFSPRVSGVWTVAKNHNIRASFQTGFRNPTTQGQYINLDIISSRLLGGLPEYAAKYGIGTNPNIYTLSSVEAFSNNFYATGQIDPSLLKAVSNYNSVEPEQVKSFEVGYKSLIANKLMVDAVYYYNMYDNFIVQQRMRKGNIDPNNPMSYLSLLNGTSDNTYQIYTNANQKISAQGAGLGLTYSLPKNYTIGGNYSWNKLITENTSEYIFGYNTPEHKVNLKFGNRKLTKNLGFMVNWRWQDSFKWESSFGDGNIPAFNTLDAQVSYKLPYKTMLKVGGSNILNKYYIQSFGAPRVGAIYYVSLTFDQLMN